MRNTRLLTLLSMTAGLLGLPASSVRAGDDGDAETVKHLSDAKHSLVDGIMQAEKSGGHAISAKFEFEDGKFWLSVYTAKEGREKEAERNTLMELKGEPNGAEWKPATEVFADREHLTRSAMQLTLLQLSKLDLVAAVKKASAQQKGTVYSAIPAVKNGRPVMIVRLATADGKTATINVDLQSGKASK